MEAWQVGRTVDGAAGRFASQTRRRGLPRATPNRTAGGGRDAAADSIESDPELRCLDVVEASAMR